MIEIKWQNQYAYEEHYANPKRGISDRMKIYGIRICPACRAKP